MPSATRLLTRSDVESLVEMRACIEAVDDAFRRRGAGQAGPSGVLGLHVPGGGFHVKAAALELARPFVAAKVNANFPGNPALRGLPTIQGALLLFDATDGTVLAIMDSMSVTTLRTAAASAVAARYLAHPAARTVTLVGCGVQARAHLDALRVVRSIDWVFVHDLDVSVARRFAGEMRAQHDFAVSVAERLEDATLQSDIVVTCTPSRQPFLGLRHLAPGTFVAAVGADNDDKQELDVALLVAATVVVDDLDQCSAIGDLHHALAAGAMQRGDVRAELAEVVRDPARGRRRDDEIIVFDSTGVALEDVAVAALAFERARERGVGSEIALGG